MNQFTNPKNINLLWDILLDELSIPKHKSSLISNIKLIFNNNIDPFIARASPKTHLMELNKHFLSQILLAVNRLLPNFMSDENIKRINISDEEISEPYKIEDILAERQNDFEKELKKKQIELDIYLNTPKPKELNFSDNNTDGKITAMDSLLADKMVERNLELELIQKTNYNTGAKSESWLSGQETSMKELKKVNNATIFNSNTNNTSAPKKVSWNDTDTNTNDQQPSIFQKLKKTDINHNTNQNITLDIIELDSNLTNKKTYDQQPSMSLPKTEPRTTIPVPIPNNVPSNTIVANAPIISQGEFIKQLNEMNTKIDNLYDVVNKLVSSIQPIITSFRVKEDTNDEIL
jgi:hypothetical protein